MALIFFMPSVLIIILRYVFDGNFLVFSAMAPLLLGIIPFTMMFIVTSVAVLRERTSGTLERLLTSPASRLDIIFGYALSFALLAFIQAAIASFVTVGLLDVAIRSSEAALLLVAVLSGVLGMSFGLFFSSFAKNEFQAVQFMPAFVLPQLLIGGLFVPREAMSRLLELLSDVLPLTYIIEALKQVSLSVSWTSELTIDLLVIVGFIAMALTLGVLSLRK
jgi:ABC-2 type transport system permease protein